MIQEEISRQFTLGASHLGECRFAEAVECFRRVLELRPDYAEAHNNLGTALLNAGLIDEAIASYQRAVEIKPELAGAYFNLGNAFRKINSVDVAIACFRRAIEVEPTMWEAHSTLGIVLHQLGRYDEAAAANERAIALVPEQPVPHCNLGSTYREQGRLDQAIAESYKALELNPGYAVAHSNLVYLLWFHPAFDAAAIYEEHRAWNRQHAAPLADEIRPHDNDRDPNRRLKIGYVSPEFRSHCQSFFTVPLLAHHDHGQFEVFCYSDVAAADVLTERIRPSADQWRDIAGRSDEQVAEIVRQDKIDILVDLTMHMSGGRLLVFARKPAPVQVCWLAYPGTTGLTTIDYRLTDPQLDPPGLFDRFYSERSVRLPDSFWCYWPFVDQPQPNELPALTNGCITFGSFNNFSKINTHVLSLWAEVLKTVAGSRLAVLAPQGQSRRALVEFMGQVGVDAGRIAFFDQSMLLRYLGYHHQVDIVLDTFPYNGHTTSFDALWMGVPVVTLVGNTVVGRAGLSQLTNLGLAELVAHTPEQYVQIAASLGADLPRLRNLRQMLRGRMQQSPLMDGARFARNVETAYRQMWRTWCAGQQ